MRKQPTPNVRSYEYQADTLPLRTVDPAAYETLFHIVSDGYGRALVIDGAGHVYVDFDGGNEQHWHAALRFIHTAANTLD